MSTQTIEVILRVDTSPLDRRLKIIRLLLRDPFWRTLYYAWVWEVAFRTMQHTVDANLREG